MRWAIHHESLIFFYDQFKDQGVSSHTQYSDPKVYLVLIIHKANFLLWAEKLN